MINKLRFGAICDYSEWFSIPSDIFGNGELYIGNNWAWHYSWCTPDPLIPGVAPNKYLHVTIVYNVTAAIGLERQNDIRIHFGYKPQEIRRGPILWESIGWEASDIGQTLNGQAIAEYAQRIFMLTPNKII